MAAYETYFLHPCTSAPLSTPYSEMHLCRDAEIHNKKEPFWAQKSPNTAHSIADGTDTPELDRTASQRRSRRGRGLACLQALFEQGPQIRELFLGPLCGEIPCGL